MEIELPPLPEDAAHWEIYQCVARYKTPTDNRNIYQRVMFRGLMFLHRKFEKYWHWCYRKSQKYAPPKAERVEDSVYRFNAWDK